MVKCVTNRIEKVTRYIGICDKPEERPMVKTKRFSRPRDPSSVFPGCPSSATKPATVPRDIGARKADAASRSTIPDELEEFQQMDKLGTWEEFVIALPTSDVVCVTTICV